MPADPRSLAVLWACPRTCWGLVDSVARGTTRRGRRSAACVRWSGAGRNMSEGSWECGSPSARTQPIRLRSRSGASSPAAGSPGMSPRNSPLLFRKLQMNRSITLQRRFTLAYTPRYSAEHTQLDTHTHIYTQVLAHVHTHTHTQNLTHTPKMFLTCFSHTDDLALALSEPLNWKWDKDCLTECDDCPLTSCFIPLQPKINVVYIMEINFGGSPFSGVFGSRVFAFFLFCKNNHEKGLSCCP